MVPDRFDGTMMLGSAKNVMDGPHAAPTGEGADSTIAERFDSAPISASNVMFGEDTRPASASGVERQPADVQRFNGGSV